MTDVSPSSDEKLSKGQKTAKQILEAAARCIQKIGAEKTSVTNIALEAGLKRSLIAYHFPKKAEIFYRVIIHILEELGQIRNRNTSGNFGRDRLVVLLETYMDFFRENEHYFNCFLHFNYLASIEDKYKMLNNSVANTGTEQIKICLMEMLEDKDIPPRPNLINDFSELLYHYLLGAIMRFYTTDQKANAQSYKEMYMKMLGKQIDLFLHYAQTTADE
jgi:AcrR family transcriptional regulator